MDSAYHVWVNGKEIGYSQGSRNAAEFDISKVIRKDEVNVLRVKVYQWSDGSYIEDQDMWVCVSRSYYLSHLAHNMSRETCLGNRIRGQSLHFCCLDLSGVSNLCLENKMLTSVFSSVVVRLVSLSSNLGLSGSSL